MSCEANENKQMLQSVITYIPPPSSSRLLPSLMVSSEVNDNKLLPQQASSSKRPASGKRASSSKKTSSLVRPSKNSLAISPLAQKQLSSDSLPTKVSSVTNQQPSLSTLDKKVNQTKKKKIDVKLLSLFKTDLQPFSIVEDKGFREFVQALNPSYELPKTDTISNTLVLRKFEACQYSTRERIKYAVSVCVTMDCWTSINTDSFMKMTAHFIGSDFKLQCILLQCVQLPDHYTSQNKAEELHKVAENWEIQNKIYLVVSDNEIKDLLPWEHFGCFEDALNLIVKDILKCDDSGISNLLQRVRSIVGHFKRSTTSNQKFITFQTNSYPGKEPKELIEDDPTRWNSTFCMLKRFVELGEAVKDIDIQDISQLTAEEWTIVEQLVKVLQPFDSVTKEFSSEKYCMASLVMPFTNRLITFYTEPEIKNFAPEIKCVVEKLLDGITKRFGNLEKESTFLIATILDPRFKKLGFSNQGVVEDAKQKLIALVKEKCTNSNTLPTTSTVTSWVAQPTQSTASFDVWSDYDRGRARCEVDNYLQAKELDRKEDPFDWWSENGHNYSYLNKVFQERFCALATCQHVFSKRGMIINERLNRLNENEAKMLMFLRYNDK